MTRGHLLSTNQVELLLLTLLRTVRISRWSQTVVMIALKLSLTKMRSTLPVATGVVETSQLCPDEQTRNDYGPLGVRFFCRKWIHVFFGRHICCMNLGDEQTGNCYICQSLGKWNCIDLFCASSVQRQQVLRITCSGGQPVSCFALRSRASLKIMIIGVTLSDKNNITGVCDDQHFVRCRIPCPC